MAPRGWAVARPCHARTPAAVPLGTRFPSRAGGRRKKQRLKKKQKPNHQPQSFNAEAKRNWARGAPRTQPGRGHPAMRPVPPPRPTDTRMGPPPPQQHPPGPAASWPRSRGRPTLWGTRDAPTSRMETRPQSPWGHHGGPHCAQSGHLRECGVPADSGTWAGTPPETPTQTHPEPSPGYGVPLAPSPPSQRRHLGAPLPPAHFKRPHLSPSAAF